MHFSKYPNKMPEVSSFEFFASQNIPQNIWFHSIFNIYERYTKSICRDIYVIRYQIYEDSVFTVHIFLRHLEISQMYLIHAPRDNFSHWVRRKRAAGENYFEDRLGYPAISMNFKTESFTYVILLIFTHFVISLTFNFLMIG